MIFKYVDVVLIFVTLWDGLLARSRMRSFRMKYRQHKSHFVVIKKPIYRYRGVGLALKLGL